MRTRVGYAGGATARPTYRNMGDHTESIQIDFDPARVSFDDLLAVFWEEHDPSARTWSVQYANVLFVHDDEQEAAARRSVEEVRERTGESVRTEIRRLDRFWVAEDYHQKYRLRHEPRVLRELVRMLPTDADLRDSTAAARANGWLAGEGRPEDAHREAPRLGLTDDGTRTLLRAMGAPPAPRCGP